MSVENAIKFAADLVHLRIGGQTADACVVLAKEIEILRAANSHLRVLVARCGEVIVNNFPIDNRLRNDLIVEIEGKRHEIS